MRKREEQPSASIVFPVRYVTNGIAVQTTSREVSHAGVLVRSVKPPPVGSRLSMALYLPNARVPEIAIANLSAIDPDGFWADFTVLDPAARMRITQLVNEAANVPDQRAFPRHAVQLRVRFRNVRELQAEYANNLSRGGMFIRTDKPPALNERIEVHIELPDGDLVSSRAVVVHRSPPGGRAPAGVGVQFIDAVDRFRERIDRYMDSLGR